MRSRLVSGRNFTGADRANPFVALISEKTAREGFPGENPIGHTIVDILPEDKRPVTIVGVVADARINELMDDAAMLCLPYWAYTPYPLALLVRSSESSQALIPELRRAIGRSIPKSRYQY